MHGAVVSSSLVKLEIDLFERPYLLQGRYTNNEHELDTDRHYVNISSLSSESKDSSLLVS